ncbi:MAG: FAD-dependent oxidoreductase [Candidatus Lokiarchaeota archaeon]|nr:FAD-dependent oxidoreductase [Candidatus Lokiarchaeota archaeon]MBD3200859.1 FAD-dependent oxidoreductase [Candidatus Lokiarchaeota archaeon]
MEQLKKKLFEVSWNLKNRAKIIDRLQDTTYDIIIIGGGITGAGVAREAVMRGLKVALVDMQDFAAGTSSRSSKLAHGGIRYLGHGEMDLVKEATTERNWMLAHIPHLIRPIPFLFIDWEGGKYNKRSIKAAVKLYDFLSDKDEEFKNFKQHEWYTPEGVLELEPKIKKEGNKGGAVYYDNNVDDARLTIETLKEAVVRGADILSYCKVVDLIKKDNNVIGIKCEDLEKKKDIKIRGKLIVNATGIWSDDVLQNYPGDVPKPVIRPTKGVHLTYRREDVGNNMATIITSITDDRAFFVLPRGDFTIIGTTDTDFQGDLANPICNKEDADYLIKSVKYYFPKSELDYQNILATYAGIRPLVKEKGKDESEVSRKHVIFFSEDGLLTIAGGKLTTWRKMAEDLFVEIESKNLFNQITREEGFSKQKFLISIDKEDYITKLKNSKLNIDDKIINHLYQQYGFGALKILELIEEDPSLKERINEDCDFIKAEILYALRYELTTHLIDVFCRRTEMSLFIEHKKQREAAEKVAEIMAKEYNWTDEKLKQEIKEYLDYINNTVAFF